MLGFVYFVACLEGDGCVVDAFPARDGLKKQDFPSGLLVSSRTEKARLKAGLKVRPDEKEGVLQ